MQAADGPQERRAAKACICYTIDEGYLLPALVSSIQARGQVAATTADVVIIVLGERGERSALAEAVASEHAVRMVFAERDAIEGRHIMFARLYLPKLLTEPYRRIIYIDGDTQVRGDLTPLIDAPIDPGRFLACRDPAVVFAELSNRWRKRVASEREAVGYRRPHADYFNSGVLVIDPESWPPLAEACFALLRRGAGTSRYPDQDLLNLAIGEHCTLISSRWNFPGFFIGSPAEARIRPRIYHFMSNPRPWIEPVRPWGAAWAKPYLKLIEDHPELAGLAPRRNRLRALRYWLQQEIKMETEYARAGEFDEPDPELFL
jgi:lipopolysaccharide biosynthesis glycosyltransferase